MYTKQAVTVSDSKKAVQHMPHSLFVKHRQDSDGRISVSILQTVGPNADLVGLEDTGVTCRE